MFCILLKSIWTMCEGNTACHIETSAPGPLAKNKKQTQQHQLKLSTSTAGISLGMEMGSIIQKKKKQ